MDKLGKIRRDHWKVRHNISKTAKFEKWYVLREQRCSSSKSVKFGDFEELYLR